MRVKTEAKRQSILAIAGPMFLEEGFGEVSMSAVAARIGGSKSTLYNYFSSKEALFTAFVVEAGRKRFSELAGVELSSRGPHAALVELGTLFLELLLSPEIVSINRLVVAEAVRIPQVGKIFYENGPQKVSAEFERVFGLLSGRGLIPADLVPLAAKQFKSLCESDTYERCLWGIEQDVSRSTIRGMAEEAAAAIGKLYALK